MKLSIGPVSIEWGSDSEKPSGLPTRSSWTVKLLEDVPLFRGPTGARWFNDQEWSGIETPSWSVWISNRDRRAAVWGANTEIVRSDAIPAVLPAALRREGFLDAHGAVIAPVTGRPHDGVFVTGLSGSGKSSLTVSCVLGGARFLSDDSVAIGLDQDALRAWPRRPSISLFPHMHRQLIPDLAGRAVDDKLIFNAGTTFPDAWVESLWVRAVVFLESEEVGGTPPLPERTLERTRIMPVSPASSFQRLLMGHPILAVDKGARPCFNVLRRLSDLPCYVMTGGRDLLDPKTACATLAGLLPSD